jgi:hypothetical protein
MGNVDENLLLAGIQNSTHLWQSCENDVKHVFQIL